jgi:hypothetical protein
MLMTRASVSRPILVIKTTNGQTLLPAKGLAAIDGTTIEVDPQFVLAWICKITLTPQWH